MPSLQLMRGDGAVEGGCRPVGGQNVPRGPPKHTYRAAAATPQTWLHPRVAKMHRHKRPHSGRAGPSPASPRTPLGHRTCHSCPARYHPQQLLCFSKWQVTILILRQGKRGKEIGEVRSLQSSEKNREPRRCASLRSGHLGPFRVHTVQHGLSEQPDPKPTSFPPHHAPFHGDWGLTSVSSQLV